eukprot:394123_1
MAATEDEKQSDRKTMELIKWEDIKSTRLQAFKQKTYQKSKKIKIKKQHKSKDTIEETKNESEYADSGSIVKGAGLGGGLGGAAIYVGITAAKTFVEAALFETVGVELSIALGATAVGAASAIGVVSLPLLAHAGYTYWCNQAEERNLEIKQKFNSEVKLYNCLLEELKQIVTEVDVLQKELQKQEDKNKRQIERHGAYTKLIVAIGPTGYGKSLVCNRLLGDKSDIYDLAQTKAAIFDVAKFGDTKSNTKELSKKSKRVIIDDGTGKNEKQFILSVVDTQGAFDSDGDDKHFFNEMKQYFSACGGVNMFCIFFKYGTKIDNNYKKLMKLYAKFWGEQFWNKCVIIVTHCDTDSKKNTKILEAGYPITLAGIKKDLQEFTNNFDDIPIYQYGEENFEASTIGLLFSLQNHRLPYAKKHKCNDIKSPMDELWDKIRPKLRQIGHLNKQLAVLDKKMKQYASKISK